jgi:hypothetical protein
VPPYGYLVHDQAIGLHGRAAADTGGRLVFVWRYSDIWGECCLGHRHAHVSYSEAIARHVLLALQAGPHHPRHAPCKIRRVYPHLTAFVSEQRAIFGTAKISPTGKQRQPYHPTHPYWWPRWICLGGGGRITWRQKWPTPRRAEARPPESIHRRRILRASHPKLTVGNRWALSGRARRTPASAEPVPWQCTPWDQRPACHWLDYRGRAPAVHCPLTGF